MPREDLLYQFKDLEQIIDLEDQIQESFRESWEDKIDFKFHPEVKNDIYVIDHKQKRIIIFDGITQRSPQQINVSKQIIDHWLCGETLKVSVEKINPAKRIEKKDLEIFFQGNLQETKEHRISLLKPGHDVLRDPSIGWKILYYPKSCVDDSINKELIGPIEKKEKELSDYSYWYAYGVVSKDSFVRSDKKQILDLCKSFLEERGFDTEHEMYGNDSYRNSEPIVLWVGRNYYGDYEFKAALGVNFGYDNGQSAFRFGLGLHLPELDLYLPSLSPPVFRGHIAYDDVVTIQAINKANERWIHHKNWGQLDKTLDEFLSQHFEIFYTSLGEILNKNKSRKYPSEESSRRRLLNTHKSEFLYSRQDLEESYEKYLDPYGESYFTHFLTWLDLASSNKVDDELKAQAEFIACCTLGIQGKVRTGKASDS